MATVGMDNDAIFKVGYEYNSSDGVGWTVNEPHQQGYENYTDMACSLSPAYVLRAGSEKTWNMPFMLQSPTILYSGPVEDAVTACVIKKLAHGKEPMKIMEDAEGSTDDAQSEEDCSSLGEQSNSTQDKLEQGIPMPRFMQGAAHKFAAENSAKTEEHVPPPPPPPPPPFQQSQAFPQSVHLSSHFAISLGSAGHPATCASACKYVRKKTGCRDGEQCKHCHLCQWHHLSRWRKAKFAEMTPEPEQEPIKQDVVSGGVRDSVAQVEMADFEGRVGGPGQPPSVGSLEHPFGCGPPCRYTWRSKGCRSGPTCFCCHLCQWSRRL